MPWGDYQTDMTKKRNEKFVKKVSMGVACMYSSVREGLPTRHECNVAYEGGAWCDEQHNITPPTNQFQAHFPFLVLWRRKTVIAGVQQHKLHGHKR